MRLFISDGLCRPVKFTLLINSLKYLWISGVVVGIVYFGFVFGWNSHYTTAAFRFTQYYYPTSREVNYAEKTSRQSSGKTFVG